MTHTKPKIEKHSPVKRPPLPAPGDSLHDALFDEIFRSFAFPFIVAAMLAILALLDWIRWYSSAPPSPGWLTAFAITAIAWAALKWRRTKPKVNQIRLGKEGERAVGQLLERLRSEGFEIFHDLGGDGYNIDHLIIGPPGVFVIETKTHSKPRGKDVTVTFDGSQILVDGRAPDRDPIAQVHAGAREIRDLFDRSTALKPFVKPVVLFPGWFVESSLRNEVWVLNANALPSLLLQEPRRLGQADISQLAAAVDTRLRASQLPPAG